MISHPQDTSPAPALRGKTVLVAGAAGGIGEGITRVLLQSGARVVAVGRKLPSLEDLARRMGADSKQLVIQAMDLAQPDSGMGTRQILQDHGTLDGAVVAIGEWGTPGRRSILELSEQDWEHALATRQTSVFRAMRTLLPATAATGALVNFNGYSADIPFPGSALVGMTNAAMKSLTISLAAEIGPRGPRIHELILGVVRTRARQLAGIDDERWISNLQVGAHVAALVARTHPLSGTVLQYLVDAQSGPQPDPPAGRR